MEEETAKDNKTVKFVDYFHEDNLIGKVSEKNRGRLDELLAKKLQAEEDASRFKMK